MGEVRSFLPRLSLSTPSPLGEYTLYSSLHPFVLNLKISAILPLFSCLIINNIYFEVIMLPYSFFTVVTAATNHTTPKGEAPRKPEPPVADKVTKVAAETVGQNYPNNGVRPFRIF